MAAEIWGSSVDPKRTLMSVVNIDTDIDSSASADIILTRIMIETWIFKKIADELYNFSKAFIKDKSWSFNFNQDDIDKAYSEHLTEVSNWANEVSFLDLNSPHKTSEIFVELDLYTMPLSRSLESENVPKRQVSEVIMNSSKSIVLLGQPGAGKTTSMKKLCLELLTRPKLNEQEPNCPVLIKLRDLERLEFEFSGNIVEYIFYLFALNIEIPSEKKRSSVRVNPTANDLQEFKIMKGAVVKVLDGLNALIIIEGFDEVNNIDVRERIISSLKELIQPLNNSRVVMTSRTGDFNYHIDHCVQYEICPLTEEQVIQFANKWLGSDERAQNFIGELFQTPYMDTALRPLTLSHLCAVFIRTNMIPEKPKAIYRKVISLLAEEWDEQRSIKRKSKYSNFEKDRKIEFLSRLSFEFTTRFKTTVFTRQDLLDAYELIYKEYDLDKNESKIITSEIESHTGLFIQSGIEKYQFSHKSLQEFLCAEYIVKLPFIPKLPLLRGIPDEMAICVAISSNSSDYLIELSLSNLNNCKNSDFMIPFLGRIELEKPEFNDSTLFIIAFINILTLAINSADSFTQINFEFFENNIDLEKVVNITQYYQFKSKDNIFAYYKLKIKDDELYGYKLPQTLTVTENMELAINCSVTVFSKNWG
jgi:hypothetical protein